MALVAYSDESDVSDIDDENDPISKSENLAQTLSSSNAKTHNMISGIDSIVDEDDVNQNISVDSIVENNCLLSSLPTANPLNKRVITLDVSEKDDVVDDVPTTDTWNITCEIKDDNSSSEKKGAELKKNKKLKFILPALSEFEEEEENEEEPVKKKVRISPSDSSSGLFSLLPNPKGITRPNQLVPTAVKSRKPIQPIKSKKIKKAADSDDEGEISSSDFFSLSESMRPVQTEMVKPIEKFTIAPTLPNVQPRLEDVSTMNSLPKSSCNDETFNTNLTDNNTNNTFIASNNDAAAVPDGPIYGPNPNSNVISDEALIRLVGRRNKNEIVNLIDVNTDDVLMSREEWMTKSLSENKPTYSYSKKREGMPSQQQRRKHQITFLAHQAKERESELNTTWSDNRQTRKQTQAKYGF